MFKNICKRIKIIFLQVKLNECKDDLIDIVLDWNKTLKEENGKLKDQIEEMKCCGNCSHFKLDNSGLYPIYVCELTYPNRCKNHDKWEITENGI